VDETEKRRASGKTRIRNGFQVILVTKGEIEMVEPLSRKAWWMSVSMPVKSQAILAPHLKAYYRTFLDLKAGPRTIYVCKSSTEN